MINQGLNHLPMKLGVDELGIDPFEKGVGLIAATGGVDAIEVDVEATGPPEPA